MKVKVSLIDITHQGTWQLLHENTVKLLLDIETSFQNKEQKKKEIVFLWISHYLFKNGPVSASQMAPHVL